jgi:hypothetical protein
MRSMTDVMTQMAAHLVLREMIDFANAWGSAGFCFEPGFRASINRIVNHAPNHIPLTYMTLTSNDFKTIRWNAKATFFVVSLPRAGFRIRPGRSTRGAKTTS